MSVSTSFLEIVELENGEIALRRQDAPEKPLVKIQFSNEAKLLLQEHAADIGRIMIGSGLRAVNKIQEEAEAYEEKKQLEESSIPEGETIH